MINKSYISTERMAGNIEEIMENLSLLNRSLSQTKGRNTNVLSLFFLYKLPEYQPPCLNYILMQLNWAGLDFLDSLFHTRRHQKYCLLSLFNLMHISYFNLESKRLYIKFATCLRLNLFRF